MYRKIDHIAIAVRSLESSAKIYAHMLALQKWDTEEVEQQRTRVAFLPLGESRIELIAPTDDTSPVASFLAKRGEGLHHVCFQVDDLAEEMSRLAAAGMRLVDPRPRPGAGGALIAFVHPSSACGVLIELSQPGSGAVR